MSYWRKEFEELPECPLKGQIGAAIEAFVEDMGPPWMVAWGG